MNCFPIDGHKDGEFTGVLVVPTVCVGNVAQLAVDLLLYNAPAGSVTRVARFEHDFVEPSVATDPLARGNGELSTEIELFQLKTSGQPVYLLQQRSPTIRGHSVQYSQDLAKWIDSQKFSRVVVLSSLDFKTRDKALDDPRPMLLPYPEPSAPTARELSVALGLALYQEPSSDMLALRPVEERRVQPWPLLRALAAPTLGLTMYATDGHNCPDSEQLASAVVQLLIGLKAVGGAAEIVRNGKTQFSFPESWTLALYGRPAEYDDAEWL